MDRRYDDLPLPGGDVRRAGEPIHSMWLRLTVDVQANILDAEACSDAVPYPGFCETIVPTYRQLIGDRIGPGFRGRVRKLFAGVQGCTHLTELISVMGTGVIQTIAGDIDQSGDEQPFQLDACHTLDTHGEGVRLFYPKWYRGGPSAGSGSAT